MSLRDQLKKAKLLSEKDAKRIAHEQRVERKEKGREQLEQEQQQHAAELEQLQAKERERTAQQQKELDAQRARREEEAAVAAILEQQAFRPGPASVRWYFETEDGSLPCLEVSPRQAQELRAGQLCVVLCGPAGTHQYRLLPGELTKRVARVRPEAVAFAPRGLLR